MNTFFISTTESIEGYSITKNLDLIFTNVVIGTGFLSEFLAGITDIIGGRSNAFQNRMNELYDNAKRDLTEKASSIGANAIVGFRISLSEISGKGVSMLMLTAFGTAVVIDRNEAGRYERYEKLLQLTRFRDAGIITEEEFSFESQHIQEYFENTLAADLEANKVKERRKKEMLEFYRQVEEEAQRRQREEEEHQRQLVAEREAKRNLLEGASERLFKGIQEVLDAGQAEFKTRIGAGQNAQSAPVDLSQFIMGIQVSPGENMFDVICDYLLDDKFTLACAYYLKATSSEDFNAAKEYVLGVKDIYEKMPLSKRIERITARTIECYSSEDTSASRRILTRYLSANETVISYLLSILAV
jgi:uncharacterized protein YbjQ (UPF0145 family)